MKRLAVFDLEGVLLKEEYLPMLAKCVGREKEILDITNKGLAGEILWEEGLRRRIDILKGVDFSQCVEIANSMSYIRGADVAVKTLKEKGFLIVVVSGGFSIFADRLKKDLPVDYIFCNELIFKDSKLDGFVLKVGSDKSIPVRKIMEKENISPENAFCVVDGANDLKLFDICSLKIGFTPNEVIKHKADFVFYNGVDEILPIVLKKFKIS